MRCKKASIVLALGLALGACAQQKPARPMAAAPPFLVPSAALERTQHRPDRATAVASINAYQLLPGSDAEDLFAPRGEKIAYGALSYGSFSTFAIYSYDIDSITTPFGTNYRYRWMEQRGLSSP